MAEENGRVCAVCGKPLTGRQERYCSKRCKKKAEHNRERGEQPDAKYTKVCPFCGKEFVTEEKGRRKYCSDKCAEEQNRTIRIESKRKKRAEKSKPVIICGWCGKEFVGRNTQARYCCKECRLAAEAAHKHAKTLESAAKTHPEQTKRVCQNCGKEFVTDDKRRKYCSAECVKEQHKAQHRAQISRYRRKKRAEKKEPVGICAWCGKEFDGRSANAKYCCKECGDLAQAARAHEKYVAIRETPEGREKLHEQYMRSGEVAQRQKRKGVLTKKICAICGKEFEAKNPVTKYCGDECRKKAAIIHSAQWHARIMETPEGRAEYSKRTKRYTETQKAKPEYVEKYEERLEQYKERYKLKKENGWTRKCAYCKKWFAGEKGVKYCSDECREAAEKEKEALMVGARTSDRICANCGKPLPEGRRQFCSDECRAAAAKLKRKKNKSKG